MSPKLVRLVVGLLGGAVALSGLAMAAAAVGVSPKVNWVLLGFELVMAAAGVMAILFSRGLFQDGPGLALACIAGTVFVSAVLGYFGSDRRLVTSSGGELSLKWFLIARVLAALALAMLGAMIVLLRNRRSLAYLAKAAATGGPVLLIGAVYVLAPDRVRAVLNALPGWATLIALGFAGVLAVVLLSASIHLLIRAFEEGRTDNAAPQP